MSEPVGEPVTAPRGGLRARLEGELRLFFVALQFLTRAPVPRWVTRAGFEPQWLNHAARYFALVGTLVATAAAAVALAALWLWPPTVAAALAVAFSVWLTVAFHEDGLADTCDALLGAAPREKALTIMKDSRIGSYGAVALILSLLLRVLLLAELLRVQPLLAAWALVLAHTAGRACAVVLMTMLPYAGDEAHAKAKPLARSVRAVDAAWAVLTAVALLALGLYAAPWPAASQGLRFMLGLTLGLGAALVLLTQTLRAWLQRRLGGFTGDTLGACEQLGEIVCLLVVLAACASALA